MSMGRKGRLCSKGTWEKGQKASVGGNASVKVLRMNCLPYSEECGHQLAGSHGARGVGGPDLGAGFESCLRGGPSARLNFLSLSERGGETHP